MGVAHDWWNPTNARYPRLDYRGRGVCPFGGAVMKQWIAALNGTTVVALQHYCGVNDAPVNCYLNVHRNWECPNCLTIYGAATPINPSDRQSVESVFDSEEE
jgi:hypothetical protein